MVQVVKADALVPARSALFLRDKSEAGRDAHGLEAAAPKVVMAHLTTFSLNFSQFEHARTAVLCLRSGAYGEELPVARDAFALVPARSRNS